jgi:excinuclease ABC subunit A
MAEKERIEEQIEEQIENEQTKTVGKNIPQCIQVRGANVHNLKNIDVDVPLHKIVGIAGVSGSGKSSLALGVLYAEGSRRYLESLSTYTRRRMTQAGRADVADVRYIPASLALHQRPGVPGIRSTFGTMTELLNSLRLMFSRLASHRCPNGHYCPPSFAVASMTPITCPVCGAKFYGPGAEDLAFNSSGACPTCGGTGIVRTVDESTLITDENLSIDQGAVAVWGTLMWSLMKDVCRLMGVRTNVPYKDLTDQEKEIVLHGPAVKKHMTYFNPNSQEQGEMDFTYFSAVRTVENALSKVKDEKGMKRVEKYLKEGVCPDCGGTRLSEAARAPRLCGISLADASAMTLSDLIEWVKKVPDQMPDPMKPMAVSICQSFLDTSKRLTDLGLGYLSLDRAAGTLSTGERQRVQLARAVRNRTTGILYVLDEPSIGLHPYNLKGLTGVMDDLVADGNSVVLVDHDTQVLGHADYLIEMGKGAGADGGSVIAKGKIEDMIKDKNSLIGPYLAGGKGRIRPSIPKDRIFSRGRIHMETDSLHTVRPLSVDIPCGRLTVVTGVSGSGKTTLVLESLVPALAAASEGKKLPGHVKALEAGGIRQVKLIDATPIGINIRSTVATYADIHDPLRKLYASCKEAKAQGLKAGDFSYNTGKLRCSTCDGTGTISLDVQFLPDVEVTCPDCRGSRYGKEAEQIQREWEDGKKYSLPDLMNMSVDQALAVCLKKPQIARRLKTLHDLGLGYLTLGEETPGLSGGEAQRLKLADEMGRGQEGSVFVFDEPTIGLHPRDVENLLTVFQNLIEQGATLVVIEHDLDVIRNADYIIDMGPGGGEEGGTIVAAGTLEDVKNCPQSRTGKFLN